jgi:FkbM family methyltransferase
MGNVEFLVDHHSGDENGARAVLTTDMYLAFLSKISIKWPVNVLDLGANVGGFPLLLQINNVRMSKVVCVELNPNTFSRLQFNLRRNLKCEETVFLNVAVTGNPCHLDLRLGSGGTGENIYQNAKVKDGEDYHIEGLTVDEIYNRAFRNKHVDICKIDIEGAEYEVFAHPHHAALGQSSFVIMEIHDYPGKDVQNIFTGMSALGFSHVTSSPSQVSVHLFSKGKPFLSEE